MYSNDKAIVVFSGG
ncbi:hypothetical protein V7295_28545, partial [Bacillus toyonensis]